MLCHTTPYDVEINVKFSQCLVFMYLLSFRQLTKELQDVLAQDPYPKTRLPNSNLPDSILRSLNQFGLTSHPTGDQNAAPHTEPMVSHRRSQP